FRGFGYVEQLDAERFGAEHGQGSFPNYPPPINGEVPQNPILTKTWFHTGAWRERADQKAAYEKDYWAGDGAAPPHLECSLPSGLTSQELREGWRALRGSVIRQEVFELDNGPLAGIPYTVSEKNYDVRKLQAPQKARGAEYPDLSAVFHVVDRESRSWAYERVANDPRVSQTLALDVDAFGIVTRSAAVAYKRRTSGQPEQNVFRCVVTEQDVLHFDNTSTGHRLGVPIESRAFELTDSSSPAAFLSLETVQTNFTNASLIPYEQTAGSGIQKRLIQREKARYYDSTALPGGLLNFGAADPKALLFKSYLLDLTDALNTAVFGPKASTAQLAPILTEGGYVTPAGETGYWLPSGHVVLSASDFFLPSSAVDSFGTTTATITYDVHNMFATSITAPLGNVVSATHDYRVLAPTEITDPNGNRQEAGYDKLGMIEAVAVKGKTTESLGDTLANPTMKWEYDLTRWDTAQKPNFVHTFARKVHQGTPSWQETYVYTDGSGRVAMTKVQAEPGDAPQRDGGGNLIVPIVQVPTNPRWVGSGRTVLNNKGNPVKQYEPYFSSLFEFETEPELVQTGVTAVITYDGLGRVLRTDFPDGSYSRVERPSAWLELAFDRNDTVDETGNLWKAQRDPLITPSASAADQRALQVTLPHKNTPTQTHSDVMGRPFLVVAHNKIGAADQFLETRTKLDIEGQVLEVKDPLIRTCQTNAYSMAGMLLKDNNIDKGARWYLGDVNGAPLRRWDDRLQVFRTSYDVLRRPTHLFMKPDTAAEVLLERMVYGDSAGTGIPDPKNGNLRGKMIRHFDGAGRVKAESYDFKGNSLTSDRVLAQSYTTTVDWGSLNLLTNVGTIDSTAGAVLEPEPPFVETRTFDALNRITKLVTPDSSEYLPVYNEASLLNAVNVKVRGVGAPVNFVANIDYDAKGQRTKIEYSDLGSGARFTTDYTYNKLTFRLTKLKTTRSSPVNTLQELSYTFDPSGNIVQVSDAAQQGLFYADEFVAPDQKFVYDAIYRLVEGSGREHRSVGEVMVDHNDQPIQNLPLPSDPNAVRNYTETYSYDEVGNITQMFHDAVANTWTRDYSYLPANNRLTETSGGLSFRYDDHGSATEMPHLPTVTYSPFDQMVSAVKPGAGTVYFTYGSSGQRVRKVWEETAAIKHERIYLGAYEIFRKRVSGTVNLERQTLHVNDGAQRIAMVETKTIDTSAPGSTGVEMRRFQLGNHLGSTMLELDETGLIISHEEYTPYGASAYRAARSSVDVSARRYRYTGKERDEETGLYYNGARYLAAWLGRWTSADPIGIGADGPGLYNYTRGSPINYTDPSGTDSIADLGQKALNATGLAPVVEAGKKIAGEWSFQAGF
ncbi:MAG: toxin, partial [Myxococcales bacterium]|nr:toxin [Myxococcales bacterium]